MLWFGQIFCWGFLGIFVCLRQIVLIDCIWCWIFFLRLFVNLHHICWIFFRLCSFVLWVLFFFVLVLFLVFCFQNLGFFFCVCFFSIFCRFFLEDLVFLCYISLILLFFLHCLLGCFLLFLFFFRVFWFFWMMVCVCFFMMWNMQSWWFMHIFSIIPGYAE